MSSILLLCLTLLSICAHKLHDHPDSSYQDYSEEDDASSKTEYGNSQRNHRTTKSVERPSPRPKMNERSISVNSGVQRVQEQERRRSDSRVENAAPRIDNGSYKIVNNPPKIYPNVAFRKGQTESRRPTLRDSVKGDSIIFPNSKFDDTPRNYTPSLIPEECRSKGFCEDLPDYPLEHVEQLINKLDVTRFKIDEIDTPEIAQRIGPPLEMELCDSRKSIVMPLAAPDKDGEWFYIVNRKDKPLQGIQVEVCKGNEMPCSELAYFYTGYTAVCKQKYVLRRMTALGDNGEAIERPFKIPSCCSCMVSRTEL